MIIIEQAVAADEAFATIAPERLDAADDAFLDGLMFGVVGLSTKGEVEVYNTTAAHYGGIKREHVLGQPFFLAVGACMNNFLVAQRFEDEELLDTVLDYVLTYRMRPTPVKLRLLKRPGSQRRYLLIKR